MEINVAWDAFKALNLYPDSDLLSGHSGRKDLQCIGSTREGRRCRIRIGVQRRNQVAKDLLKLSELRPTSSRIPSLLDHVADNSLCHYHIGQADDFVESWRIILSTVSSNATLVPIAAPPAVQTPLARTSGTAWNPFTALQVHPTAESYCIGYAPSKGRRCHNPVAQANALRAEKLLERISNCDPKSSVAQRAMSEIASLLLCKRFHQDQATNIACKWTRIMDNIHVENIVQIETVESAQSNLRTARRPQPTASNIQSATPTAARPSHVVRFGLATPPSSAERDPVQQANPADGKAAAITTPTKPPRSNSPLTLTALWNGGPAGPSTASNTPPNAQAPAPAAENKDERQFNSAVLLDLPSPPTHEPSSSLPTTYGQALIEPTQTYAQHHVPTPAFTDDPFYAEPGAARTKEPTDFALSLNAMSSLPSDTALLQPSVTPAAEPAIATAGAQERRGRRERLRAWVSSRSGRGTRCGLKEWFKNTMCLGRRGRRDAEEAGAGEYDGDMEEAVRVVPRRR